MPKIKSPNHILNFDDPETPNVYRIRPQDGVVSHFPKRICEGLVKLGAEWVDEKTTSKKSATDNAK